MNNKKGISKAQAVRKIAQSDPSITNSQIKEIARKTYGLNIESNQIIGLLGSELSRRGKGPSWANSVDYAKRFIHTVGGYQNALRALHFVREGT